ARARASAVLRRLRGWPARARFEDHLAELRALVERELGWRADSPSCAPLLEPIEALARELPGALVLERDELARLVAAALDEAAEGPLGGAGAGVQVLTVTASRSRTFEHLFLLGMNRDSFPRAPSDDPVLPDALRARLRVVLPEMPVKARVRDEERHWFASLCAAAPQVVLAWQHADDDGRARIESPFVVRLRVARPDLPLTTAAPTLAAEPGADPALAAAPRPAGEHLALGGQRHRGASLAGVRALALGEVRAALREDPAIGDRGAAALDVAALARHQLAVLRELDAPPPAPGAPARPLGLWLGRVGSSAPAADGAEPELYVTRLEDLARCPWQAFLRHELGLEPVPDALAALPAPTPLLLGKVSHAVLERIVQSALPAPRETLAEALALGPVRAPWPDAAQLDAWLAEESARAAREEGIAIPGFARALARRVRPLLEVARATDWSDPRGPSVLGAELRGVVELADVAGRRRRIGCRADRVDLKGDALSVTDYKSGKPVVDQTKPDGRHRAFLRAVREGRLLQAAAYRIAARALAPERAVAGRYLYLREDAEPRARVLAVGDDPYGDGIADAFHETARALLDAADHGFLVPRLDTGEGQPPCAWCEVQAACLQGESGPRARLAAWAERARERRAAGALEPADGALLRIVRLREDAREAAEDDVAGAGEGA
ncbi:MAG TPA: PD-(D/E)XK nuclease family protein, partial [Myxococcota bacterium]|nr:PD-(D/E)XK nuclease family protein [Myxococcota bacterium]